MTEGGMKTPLPEFQETANALSDAVYHLPLEQSTNISTTLYRGQSCFDRSNLHVGDELLWHAFSSTTTNKRVAQGFAGGGCLFELYGVTERIGASISKFSVYPNEEEVLLQRGIQFVVEGMDTWSSPITIRLRVKTTTTTTTTMNDPLPPQPPSPHIVKKITSSTTAPAVPIAPVAVAAPNLLGYDPIRCVCCQLESYLTLQGTLKQQEGKMTKTKHIATNTTTTTSFEEAAMTLLQDPTFQHTVYTQTQFAFNTRIPYFHQSSSGGQCSLISDMSQRRPWLYMACRSGLATVTRELLRLGASPMESIDMGSTALHVAAYYGHLECVRMLLEHTPSDPSNNMKQELIRKKNKVNGHGGLTALDEAKNEAIRALIRMHM